ncbi:MAG: hypothetical protein HY917_04375 [Candidatus Diapherotrites archaeon]|nr:hypothetical protein [Candidatus Diapherotrites archaeon]
MSVSEQLRFAYRYPFSSAARSIVAASGLSLGHVSEELVGQARSWLLRKPGEKKPVLSDSAFSRKLEEEVLSFPVAKAIVSQTNASVLMDGFALSVAYWCSESVQKEDPSGLLDLAQELGLKPDLLKAKPILVCILVPDFVQAAAGVSSLKLVNQRVENGNVFLGRSEMEAVLIELIRSRVRSSLPVKIGPVPSLIAQAANEVVNEHKKRRKATALEGIQGTIVPSLFPDCMKELYSRLQEGRNVPHLGRFSVATFLLSIGMKSADVVALFAKTPNFNEKLTRYHVDRLAEGPKGKVSAPSCAKLKEYGLACTDCRFKHPISKYVHNLKNGGENPADH